MAAAVAGMHSVGAQPHATNSVAVQHRNYTTVAALLHEKTRQHDEASRMLAEERALVQQLQQQLGAASSRAEQAEQQAQLQKELQEQLVSLQSEASTQQAARQQSDQQCKALQEQLSRWALVSTSMAHQPPKALHHAGNSQHC
jgi:hypothetical protein